MFTVTQYYYSWCTELRLNRSRFVNLCSKRNREAVKYEHQNDIYILRKRIWIMSTQTKIQENDGLRKSLEGRQYPEKGNIISQQFLPRNNYRGGYQRLPQVLKKSSINRLYSSACISIAITFKHSTCFVVWVWSNSIIIHCEQLIM